MTAYIYNIDGKRVSITRTLVGKAYARNGNAGNPTEYFAWSASVDGAVVASGAQRRSDAYEIARSRIQGTRYATPRYGSRGIGIRDWQVVQAEIARNYVGKA